LATIEAIYFTLKEYITKVNKVYKNEFDDLLFFYIFNYNLIQDLYLKENKEFKKKDNYILSHSKND
jgi:hypothetical protein